MASLAEFCVVPVSWMRGWKYGIRQGSTISVPPEVYALMGDGQRTLELVCKHLQVVELPPLKFMPPELPVPEFSGFRVKVPSKEARDGK